MKFFKNRAVITGAVLLGLYVAGALFGQLQQSGGPGSTVTANAGTNLNTSALALETGGNLATISGAVSSAHMNVAGSLTGITTVTAVMELVRTTNIPKDLGKCG
jgi:hypothetical protein